MKIIISGGWGFGNLGDDAILVALIKMVYELYPEAKLSVLSYNQKHTQEVLKEYPVKVYSSIHKTLMGNTINRQLRLLNKKNSYGFESNFSFRNRVINYLVRQERIYKEKRCYLLFNLFKTRLNLLPNHKIFKDCDLFILGGGEYLNVWNDSVYAHTLELYLANKYGSKSLILGQSIGPFSNDKTKSILLDALKRCDGIFVRDSKSQKELKSSGINSSIVPDLALTEKYPICKSNFISVIISRELSDNSVSNLAEVLKEILKITDVNIKILISRRWLIDLKLAKKLHNQLGGKRNFLIIPGTYDELNYEIQNSKLIISSNLHGLILGWRASVPCICLNNRRKFISFMEQTKQEDRIFSPKELEIMPLFNKIEQVLRDVDHGNELDNFAKIFITTHKKQVKNVIRSAVQ